MASRKKSRKTYLRKYWLQMPSWRKVEHLVAIRLRMKGVACKYVGRHHSPFDLLTTNGRLRIEIKSSTYSPKYRSWTISLARGDKGKKKLTEDMVDYYVWVLRGHPALLRKKPLYVILPSPVRKHTVSLTLPKLFGKWHSAVGNWALIVDAEQRRVAAKTETEMLAEAA